MFQEPQKRTARQLLSAPKITIPVYQRGYAWGDEEIDDFIEDIRDLWKSSSAATNEHFLGMMLCYSRVDAEWGHALEVIDGQQRLTTTSLLTVAFREAYQRILRAEAASEKIKKQAEAAVEQLNKLLFADPAEATVTKLSLNEKDADEWTLLVRRGTPLDPALRRLAPQSMQNLSNALERMTEDLIGGQLGLDTPKAVQDSLATLNKLVERTLDGLSVVLLTAESEKAVYDLFMIINDRGKPLSPLDLIRTGTLSKLKERKKDFEKAKLYFAPLLDAEEDEAGRALVHFINSHMGARVPKNALLKKLSQWLYRGEGEVSFHEHLVQRTRQLSEGTEYLISLAKKKPDWFGEAYPFENDKVGAERQHRLIAALRHESAKPLLVAGKDVLAPVEFRKMLGVLERIAMRAFVTGRIHKSALADFHIDQAARMRANPAAWSALQMWKDALSDDAGPGAKALDLRNLCTDEIFRGGVRVLDYRGNRGTIAYMLLTIDSFEFDEGRPNTETMFHWSDIHLDHIVPQSSKSSQVVMDGLVHTIGNLTPIAGKKNSKLADLAYGQEKAIVYKSSKVMMTRAIGADYDDWNVVQVQARTETLADQACKVWSLSESLWD